MRRAIALLLFCLLSVSLLSAQESWDNVERIVAIGDVHGDLGQFVKLLQSSGIVDARSKWVGGKAHLVQLGDVPDRGPDTRKVMDLLMELEKQARKAGGMVHSLIGNHEAMNVYGDLRYVIPEEYASFRTPDSTHVRDAIYERHLEQLAADPAQSGKNRPNAEYRKKWEAQYPLGFFEHRIEFGPMGKYGKWILSHNAIIRINDTVFVHGGISPKYVDFKRAQINGQVRGELKDFQKLPGGIVQDTEGPLWYRGLAEGDETVLAAHVETVLANHEVRRVVLGHTPTDGAIIPRFGGRVIQADAGMSAAYGSRLACLVIEGSKAYALHRGSKLDLPSAPGLPLLQYLKAAAALDPSPSPLLKSIADLEAKIAAPAGR